MNMKRASIVFFALIVWFCLANGAFAEEYMVILIGVDSGNVEGILAADQLGSPPDTSGRIILRCKKGTPHENPHGTPIPLPEVISESTIVTKFAASSPGCRYIWYNGRYIKVCN
jgi:hypothetical protein